MNLGISLEQESTFLVEMILVSFTLQGRTQLLCVWPYHKRGKVVFSKPLVCINCHSNLLADILVFFFAFVLLIVVINNKLIETSFSILEIQILKFKKMMDVLLE